MVEESGRRMALDAVVARVERAQRGRLSGPLARCARAARRRGCDGPARRPFRVPPWALREHGRGPSRADGARARGHVLRGTPRGGRRHDVPRRGRKQAHPRRRARRERADAAARDERESAGARGSPRLGGERSATRARRRRSGGRGDRPRVDRARAAVEDPGAAGPRATPPGRDARAREPRGAPDRIVTRALGERRRDDLGGPARGRRLRAGRRAGGGEAAARRQPADDRRARRSEDGRDDVRERSDRARARLRRGRGPGCAGDGRPVRRSARVGSQRARPRSCGARARVGVARPSLQAQGRARPHPPRERVPRTRRERRRACDRGSRVRRDDRGGVAEAAHAGRPSGLARRAGGGHRARDQQPGRVHRARFRPDREDDRAVAERGRRDARKAAPAGGERSGRPDRDDRGRAEAVHAHSRGGARDAG